MNNFDDNSFDWFIKSDLQAELNNLQVFLNLISDFKKIKCVVEGFDENSEDAQDLYESMSDILGGLDNVRFFIMGRLERDMDFLFSDLR